MYKQYTLECVIWILLFCKEYNNCYILLFAICYLVAEIIILIFSSKLTYQKQLEYNNFADKRCICCIRNFGDVFSNVMFFIAGLYQFYYANYILSILSICVGFGSTYYHWTPNMYTLYWDRLPMVVYMAYIINITTKLDFGYMLLIGIYSLEYHVKTNNLTLYASYQLSIIILFSLFTGLGMHISVLFYISAKICEDNDKAIFIGTNKIISGHSIKHILAGLAMLFIGF